MYFVLFWRYLGMFELLAIYHLFLSFSLNLLNPCLSPVTSLLKSFLIGVLVEFISGYDLTLYQILERLTMNRIERKLFT